MSKRLRIESSIHTFFVTCVVKKRVRLFRDNRIATITLRSLDYYQTQRKCDIHAWVLMPDHLHLLFTMANGQAPGRLIGPFKSWVTHCAKELSCPGGHTLVSRLQDGERLRLWESRFDEVAIRSPIQARRYIEYIHNNPVRRGLVSEAGEYVLSSYRQYAEPSCGEVLLRVTPLELV